MEEKQRPFEAQGNPPHSWAAAMTGDGLPGLSFAIFEETMEALVNAFDGLEEFIDPNGFASHFVSCHTRGYGVAELSGAADAFGSQQREHGEWILMARLALLPLLNGPGGLAHIIHGIPEFPEDAWIEGARAHFILQPDQVGAGFL
jgi:hypothetical protein